jgi:uncharacterized protein (TIGR02246 family)
MAQMEALSVEQRLDQVESRQAIREVMAGYAFGCDNHDGERFMRIFHDDAIWNVGGIFGDANGAEEIKKVLEDIWVSSPETRHWITDVTVDFAGADSATGDAHTICFVKNSDGDELFVACDYDNSYERRDGTWRMSRCTLNVHWWKKVELESM